jgi:hypothetical protein
MKHYPTVISDNGDRLIVCATERKETIEDAKQEIKEMRAGNPDRNNIYYRRYEDTVVTYKSFSYLVKCNDELNRCKTPFNHIECKS